VYCRVAYRQRGAMVRSRPVVLRVLPADGWLGGEDTLLPARVADGGVGTRIWRGQRSHGPAVWACGNRSWRGSMVVVMASRCRYSPRQGWYSSREEVPPLVSAKVVLGGTQGGTRFNFGDGGQGGTPSQNKGGTQGGTPSSEALLR
jgi:hypothetical protein